MSGAWEVYTAEIDHLAHITIRKWMVGTDLDDIKQSIWTEYFRILEVRSDGPLLCKREMIELLRHYAASLKREEGDRKFGKKQSREELISENTTGLTDSYWRKVKHLWEGYLSKIKPRDAILLRYAAQGAKNSTIAAALNLSTKRIESIKSSLIKTFKEEVENSVQTDITRRDS